MLVGLKIGVSTGMGEMTSTSESRYFRASQFSRYLLRNVGSFKKDKNVRADDT
jgi:hypothetical protein